MSEYKVTILGAGLAGCEAALWLAGKGAHRRHISCRHLHTSIFTAQRQEFILLPREIHIDVQFHVLLVDRSEGKAYL